MDYLIRGLKVYFSKSSFYAVDDVDFDLKEHTIFALVGETGSGKTMISRAISGLLPFGAQASGEVLRASENLLLQSKENMRKYRQKHIAMVFQNASAALNPLLSLKKQLRLSCERRLSMSEMTSLMERVHLEATKDFLKKYPFELSGGMKQRFLLAMALIKNPEVLILDEPTRGMDFALRMEILREIEVIYRNSSMSILLITHDLEFARMLSDRMAVLHTGRIVEIGNTEKLFQNPSHPYWKSLLHSTSKYGFQSEKRIKWSDEREFVMSEVESDHWVRGEKNA